MSRISLLPLLALLTLAPLPSTHADEKPTRASEATANRPPIDLVFAIDCSGSMGGVIETAKQKIWDIVGEIGAAKPAPRLRIGLLGYGNGDKTWRKFDLSSDLDTVYRDLMTFKDEGWSSEFVGQAVQKSLKEMSWSEKTGSGTALRVIYVVGNETAEQGPISYRTSAPEALKADIFVNAIYCGGEGLGALPHNSHRIAPTRQKLAPANPNAAPSPNTAATQGQQMPPSFIAPSRTGGMGAPETWQHMASLGGGKYLEIAADGGSVVIPTPYDKDLGEKSVKLNGTYLGYGSRGAFGLANQMAQDANANGFGRATVAARAVAKGSVIYDDNANWDLVNKSKEKGFVLEGLKVEELPAEMKTMTPEQRKSHLETKTREREALQKEIADLGIKRRNFIEAEMKKNGKANSLDAAIVTLVRQQAGERGFKF